MRVRVVVAGLVVAGVAIGGYVLAGQGDEQQAVPPPIMPVGESRSEITIPDGFLTADAKSVRPVADQGCGGNGRRGRTCRRW